MIDDTLRLNKKEMAEIKKIIKKHYIESIDSNCSIRNKEVDDEISNLIRRYNKETLDDRDNILYVMIGNAITGMKVHRG